MYKAIPNYEHYGISEDGVIVNFDTGKILKTQKDKDGYLRIGIYKDKKRKFFQVHRLVALAYIPNPKKYPEVDHINQVKDDNMVENLRWITQSGNQRNTTKKRKNILPTGVYLSSKNRYQCRMRIDEKYKYLGTYDTLEEASKVYQDKYNEIMSEFTSSSV